MQTSPQVVQEVHQVVWPQIVAASAASIAAAAAWRTAAINGRNLRRSLEPILLAQPIAMGPAGGSRQIHMDVHNAGGGVALASGYMLVIGDALAQGYFREGTLRPGAHFRVRTAAAPVGDLAPVGVIACRDAAGMLWAWQMGGLGRKRVGRVRTLQDEATFDAIFKRMVPDVELSGLHPIASDVLTGEEFARLDDPLFTPTPEQILGALTGYQGGTDLSESHTPGKPHEQA